MQLEILSSEDVSMLLNKMAVIEEKLDSISGGKELKTIYTIKDACALLQVSKRTLQKYRDEGKLSFSQISDKIYFLQADIEAFLHQNRVIAFKK